MTPEWIISKLRKPKLSLNKYVFFYEENNKKCLKILAESGLYYHKMFLLPLEKV